MKVYVGQTRAAAWIRRCLAEGFGEMTVRGQLPARRANFAYDNGAFGDWKEGRAFDFTRYTRDLRIIRDRELHPDFLVLPDVPGNGGESLALSSEWIDWTRSVLAPVEVPLYLAVQDGMEPAAIPQHPISGIFVGGTLPWKLRTGGGWVRWAHQHGLRCHIGRVGTAKRVRWANRIGADSIDSCLPLWSERHFDTFCAALGGHKQLSLTFSGAN